MTTGFRFLSSDLTEALRAARSRGEVIVLATGVFDVVHAEHIAFLQKAKALGWLIVGVESDARVAEMKGPTRPVNPAARRVTTLEALQIADAIFVLPDHFNTPAAHEALIAEVRPQYLAVSAHTAHLDKKQAILAKYGGEVKVVHEHNPSVSTTILLADRRS